MALGRMVTALVGALLGFGGEGGMAMSGAHLLIWMAVVVVIVGVELPSVRWT